MEGRTLPWLVIGIACLAASCSLAGPGLELDLMLPPLPEAWQRAFGELRCEIRSVAPDGGAIEAEIGPWAPCALTLAAGFPAGTYVPLLLTPVVPSTGVRLRPAGAVFPLDVEPDGRTFHASWEHGCAAMLLSRLLAAGSLSAIEPEALDVARLVREMDRKGGEDPWGLDVDALLASIADNGDHGWECQRLPTRRVLIPEAELPEGTGGWEFVLDDPLAAPACRTDESPCGPALLVEALALGFHRLFPSEGSGVAARAWLDLDVAETETVWLERRAP